MSHDSDLFFDLSRLVYNRLNSRVIIRARVNAVQEVQLAPLPIAMTQQVRSENVHHRPTITQSVDRKLCHAAFRGIIYALECDTLYLISSADEDPRRDVCTHVH